MKKKNLKTGKRAPELKRGKPVLVQRLVRQMWAVRWLDFDGHRNPHPSQHGAWMICATRSLAEAKRINSEQVISRVRVVILPNEKGQR
jgi:hypothetical protein